MSLIFIVDDDPDVRELVEYKLVQPDTKCVGVQRTGGVACRAGREACPACSST